MTPPLPPDLIAAREAMNAAEEAWHRRYQHIDPAAEQRRIETLWLAYCAARLRYDAALERHRSGT